MAEAAGLPAQGLRWASDAYVIAISGVQLGAIPMDHGISRLPLAVETVFPVGPLAVILNTETRRIEGSRVSERFLIRNANKAPVRPLRLSIRPMRA